MRDAGVNLVNLGIFSWAQVQPAHDVYNFGWLDEILDLLHEHGIVVDLGTGTSSPPPWLTTLHPEILPVTETGADPLPRRATAVPADLTGLPPVRAAARTDHGPALRRPPGADYVARVERARLPQRRRLLRRRRRPPSAPGWQTRYGDLDALNAAWGTAFWSQRYSAWEQILPPRTATAFRNPTQLLDFRPLLVVGPAGLLAGRDGDPARGHAGHPDHDQLHGHGQPGRRHGLCRVGKRCRHRVQRPLPHRWPDPTRTRSSASPPSQTSGIAGHEPWLLMEHSTSAVQWQPVNLPKVAGTAAAGQPDPRRVRFRRGVVLPVARVRCRRREVPLGDGAARRRRLAALARHLRPRCRRRLALGSRWYAGDSGPSGRSCTTGSPALGERAERLTPATGFSYRGDGDGLVERVPLHSGSPSTCCRATPTSPRTRWFVAPLLFVVDDSLRDGSDGLRRRWRSPRDVVLLRHRRRQPARPPRRLPRSPARPARGTGRGVRPAAVGVSVPLNRRRFCDDVGRAGRPRLTMRSRCSTPTPPATSTVGLR